MPVLARIDPNIIEKMICKFANRIGCERVIFDPSVPVLDRAQRIGTRESEPMDQTYVLTRWPEFYIQFYMRQDNYGSRRGSLLDGFYPDGIHKFENSERYSGYLGLPYRPPLP